MVKLKQKNSAKPEINCNHRAREGRGWGIYGNSPKRQWDSARGVCVCVLGGEGGGGGIVRMCVPNGPLFQHCQVYD